MNASLRALLTGIVDYAGLFPPAKLPLDQAIRNYARYRKYPDAWMLGRFICPAARLAELTPFVEELFNVEMPLSVSALGRGGNARSEFHAGLDADLRDVAAFRKRHSATSWSRCWRRGCRQTVYRPWCRVERRGRCSTMPPRRPTRTT